MPKFANRPTNLHGAISTTDERTRTYEGAQAYEREAKSDLFLLAATNMVSEDTFYESARKRDDRFEKLILTVVNEDPEWVARFVPFLRTEMLMRSASIVVAAEYVRAGGPHGRAVISSALQRADEPGEMLAYWQSTYGRNIPMAVKRGVADAAVRLFNERAALRYDGKDRPWRLGDVIELTHPNPKDQRQSALFRYLLDQRHHNDVRGDLESLPTIAADRFLRSVPEPERRALLGSDVWTRAGWNFERASGWLPGGMDAQAWEAVIPSMGAMALVRNLRNFDQAGISEAMIDFVIAKITSPADIAMARLFPYQVFSVYEHAPSDNWKRALAKTLDLTCKNIPELSGGTLVLIDTSGSMQAAVSGRSTRSRASIAAVMAAAIHRRSPGTDLVIFADGSANMLVPPGMSTLKIIDDLVGSIGRVGSSTYGHTALRRHWDPARHKRAIIVTDDQMWDSGRHNLDDIPAIFTFNLAGYAPSALPSGEKGRYSFGGFSDTAFRLVPLIEDARDGSWPF